MVSGEPQEYLYFVRLMSKNCFLIYEGRNPVSVYDLSFIYTPVLLLTHGAIKHRFPFAKYVLSVDSFNLVTTCLLTTLCHCHCSVLMLTRVILPILRNILEQILLSPDPYQSPRLLPDLIVERNSGRSQEDEKHRVC